MERGMAGGLKAVISGILALLALFSAVSPVFSQTPLKRKCLTAAAPLTEVRQMMELMQTPQVKQWMSTQMATAPASDSAASDQMSVLSGLLQHARLSTSRWSPMRR